VVVVGGKVCDVDFMMLLGSEVELVYGLLEGVVDLCMECIGWLGEFFFICGFYFIGYCGCIWMIW